MNTGWTPCLAYSRKHFFTLQKVANRTDKYLDQVLKRKIGSLLYIRLCVSVQIDRRRKTENREELWRPSFLCCCCCFLLLLKLASTPVITAYNTAIKTPIPPHPQHTSFFSVFLRGIIMSLSILASQRQQKSTCFFAYFCFVDHRVEMYQQTFKGTL